VDPDRRRIEALLADSGAAAFRILLHPELRPSAYVEYRIWRNDPAIRFKGIIRESVVPAIVRLANRERCSIRTADLVLRHVGYEGDQRRKHLRNLPLLRRELARHPTDLFVRHHLFRVLHGLGHEGGRGGARRSPLARRRWGSAVVRSRARGPDLRRGDPSARCAGDETGELVTHALAPYPENCVFLVTETRRLMDQRRFQPAVERVERVLEIARCQEPSLVAYDRRLLGDPPTRSRPCASFASGATPRRPPSMPRRPSWLPRTPRIVSSEIWRRPWRLRALLLSKPLLEGMGT